jgi:CMP-N-acetylneuraminic acid synthetase
VPAVNVFVPCRAGSQRVPGKNTRPIGPWQGGLIELKLRQLADVPSVSSVVVSTDDPVVDETARRIAGECDKEIQVIGRPPELAIADSLDDFLAWVPTIMPEGVTAWTHVTSPFFDADWMSRAITAYETEVINGPFDSLMAVTALRTFLWSKTGCVSHDRSQIKWPQTQDLEPLYEVNSALFMIDNAEMLRRADRIGDAPFLFETTDRAGFDIDWPEDFQMAELMLQQTT